MSRFEEVGRVPLSRQPLMVGATAEAVGRECEAFLSGRYYELLWSGAGAPGWVYVNAVARAGRQELERLAKRSASPNEMSAALSYLACEVLCLCEEQNISLRRAQQEILVPLERDLVSYDSSPATPASVVAAVRARLTSNRASRHSQRAKEDQ